MAQAEQLAQTILKSTKPRPPLCADCIRLIPNAIVYEKIETIIESMLREEGGLFVSRPQRVSLASINACNDNNTSSGGNNHHSIINKPLVQINKFEKSARISGRLFTGSDLIQWMQHHLELEGGVQEASHLANLIASYGYIFPVDDSQHHAHAHNSHHHHHQFHYHHLNYHVQSHHGHNQSMSNNQTLAFQVKNDQTLYCFQAPCLWPSNWDEPDNLDYAIYLCKRSLLLQRQSSNQNNNNDSITSHSNNNIHHNHNHNNATANPNNNQQTFSNKVCELADYELETLSRLQRVYSAKWEHISEEAWKRLQLERNSCDKLQLRVLEMQERAFWSHFKPFPGCVSGRELDMKKLCRMSKVTRNCVKCLEKQRQLLLLSSGDINDDNNRQHGHNLRLGQREHDRAPAASLDADDPPISILVANLTAASQASFELQPAKEMSRTGPICVKLLAGEHGGRESGHADDGKIHESTWEIKSSASSDDPRQSSDRQAPGREQINSIQAPNSWSLEAKQATADQHGITTSARVRRSDDISLRSPDSNSMHEHNVQAEQQQRIIGKHEPGEYRSNAVSNKSSGSPEWPTKDVGHDKLQAAGHDGLGPDAFNNELGLQFETSVRLADNNSINFEDTPSYNKFDKPSLVSVTLQETGRAKFRVEEEAAHERRPATSITMSTPNHRHENIETTFAVSNNNNHNMASVEADKLSLLKELDKLDECCENGLIGKLAEEGPSSQFGNERDSCTEQQHQESMCVPSKARMPELPASPLFVSQLQTETKDDDELSQVEQITVGANNVSANDASVRQGESARSPKADEISGARGASAVCRSESAADSTPAPKTSRPKRQLACQLEQHKHVPGPAEPVDEAGSSSQRRSLYQHEDDDKQPARQESLNEFASSYLVASDSSNDASTDLSPRPAAVSSSKASTGASSSNLKRVQIKRQARTTTSSPDVFVVSKSAGLLNSSASICSPPHSADYSDHYRRYDHSHQHDQHSSGFLDTNHPIVSDSCDNSPTIAKSNTLEMAASSPNRKRGQGARQMADLFDAMTTLNELDIGFSPEPVVPEQHTPLTTAAIDMAESANQMSSGRATAAATTIGSSSILAKAKSSKSCDIIGLQSGQLMILAKHGQSSSTSRSGSVALGTTKPSPKPAPVSSANWPLNYARQRHQLSIQSSLHHQTLPSDAGIMRKSSFDLVFGRSHSSQHQRSDIKQQHQSTGSGSNKQRLSVSMTSSSSNQCAAGLHNNDQQQQQNRQYSNQSARIKNTMLNQHSFFGSLISWRQRSESKGDIGKISSSLRSHLRVGSSVSQSPTVFQSAHSGSPLSSSNPSEVGSCSTKTSASTTNGDSGTTNTLLTFSSNDLSPNSCCPMSDTPTSKADKILNSYVSFSRQWSEYDPFLSQPIPSNPWLSDSTEFWDNQQQTKEVNGRRVRRWAFSLRELLQDPAGRIQLSHFLEKEFSAENLKFWEAVQQLKRVRLSQVASLVESIWDEYLAPDANCPINIDSKSFEATKSNLQRCKNNRNIYDEAANHVYLLMRNDSYPRFLRSDAYKDFLRLASSLETKKPRSQIQVSFDVFKSQALRQRFNSVAR